MQSPLTDVRTKMYMATWPIRCHRELKHCAETCMHACMHVIFSWVNGQVDVQEVWQRNSISDIQEEWSKYLGTAEISSGSRCFVG